MEKTGNRLLRRILGHSILAALGWKASPLEQPVKKAVIIMAPHSSTWDIIIGLLIRLATGIRLQWVGKKELFKGPLGRLFKYLGGIPLDREGTHNLVDAMIKEFAKRDTFLYGIAPEGSRSHRKFWRSGFYHIATGAGVPIVFFYLDFKTKVGGAGPIFHPTGDMHKDLETTREFYSKITPKNPDKCGPIEFSETKTSQSFSLKRKATI